MQNNLVHFIELTVAIDNPDPNYLWNKFLSIINKVGVTIINSNFHIFPISDGLLPMSGTILIMESHSAIHTWPEKGLAWLFFGTCSVNYQSQINKFKELINEYWKIITENYNG